MICASSKGSGEWLDFQFNIFRKVMKIFLVLLVCSITQWKRTNLPANSEMSGGETHAGRDEEVREGSDVGQTGEDEPGGPEGDERKKKTSNNGDTNWLMEEF